jgi:hypothetical protein
MVNLFCAHFASHNNRGHPKNVSNIVEEASIVDIEFRRGWCIGKLPTCKS